MGDAWANDAEASSTVERFLRRTLPLAEWTHAAHLTVAVYFCSELERGVAERELPLRIQQYNAAMGIPTTPMRGYHETITVFHLRAVRRFLAEEAPPGGALAATANALIASRFGARDLVHAYYSRERLFSDEAKRSFVEPDLRPLDF